MHLFKRHLFTVVTGLFVLLLTSCAGTLKKYERTPTRFSTFGNFSRQAGEPFGVVVRGDEIYFSDGQSGEIVNYQPGETFSTFAKGLSTPSQIAFDDKGNLLVADSGSHTIKRISADKKIELVAGVENKPGFADGDAKSALFHAPVGIAFADGKIFVADTYNDRIRVIDSKGQVSTLAGGAQGFADGSGAAAMFNTPCGLAYIGGRLIVADSANKRIRAVSPDGTTVTLAGNGGGELVDGSLESASFVQPVAVAADIDGGIYVADGNALRKITSGVVPIVKTINSGKRGLGDGPAREARLNRPSGIAVAEDGKVYITDSENSAVRVFGAADDEEKAKPKKREERSNVSDAEQALLRTDAEPLSAEEFRAAAEPRWPYDPPSNKREIAGTLGEVRGEMKEGSDEVWFHNGLDVVGGYGETSRFVRSEKVLKPLAAENFGTLRELVRMPTMGYIHIRLGRDQTEKPYDDVRFVFSRDAAGKLNGVRIPRGAEFKAGEPIGTLNPMNHTHLIAGRSGSEMNALAALELPGVSDKIAPVIEETAFYDENWKAFETAKPNSRINLRGKVRIVVKAYDRMDGNAERRRLGVYEVGYQVMKPDGTAVGERKTSIKFDRLPEPDAVFLVYANGSKSGATGETIFRYIATNEVHGDVAREDFLDLSAFPAGEYVIRLTAGDFFGNKATKDVTVTIN